ncbi:MAG: hypothetical protein K0M70_10370 [Arenimonas sp.]|uniref:hypothetical protein n=1 Tax=Arenimonas sp. TaxID=1872635 RepID=UPI0025BCE300|nr:hypothetical protein [Arenimonas sp.]MBW8368250.1 hypothetical protein [Arenimonas sp.]
MTRRLPAWTLLALLALVLSLAACRKDAPEEAKAPGNPVAAVEGLAQALRDNDLLRYSRLSLPPELHARTEALWNDRVAQADPVADADAAEYDKMMARLTAPDAEAELNRDLEPKLAKLEAEIAGQWPLMQATALIFVNAAIQANTDLSAEDKTHASEVVAGLMAWAQPELFTDRARARAAVAALVDTANALDLPTLAQARALPMVPAMEKGGIALAGVKQVAKAYDLDLDRALDGVRAELVSAQGDRAQVKVRYPLLDKTVSFEMAMLRRGDSWYSAQAVADAEAELAEAGEAAATTSAGAPANPAG